MTDNENRYYFIITLNKIISILHYTTIFIEMVSLFYCAKPFLKSVTNYLPHY